MTLRSIPMNITSCKVILREKMVPQGTEDNLPAWLRAQVSVVLEDSTTIHGIFVRDGVADSEVFLSFKGLAAGAEVSDTLKAELECPILLAYQKEKYPWLAKHPAPLHSLTLEILEGLREYYDAADLLIAQREVNKKVIKLLRKKKHWSQDDYLAIKDKVEPVLKNIENLFENEEEAVP